VQELKENKRAPSRDFTHAVNDEAWRSAVSGNCLVIQLISRARDRLARVLTVSIVTIRQLASRGIL